MVRNRASQFCVRGNSNPPGAKPSLPRRGPSRSVCKRGFSSEPRSSSNYQKRFHTVLSEVLPRRENILVERGAHWETGLGKSANRFCPTVRAPNWDHGDNLTLRFVSGAPDLSRKRMAPCQLPCSLKILKTMTLRPFFKVTLPLSASSSSVRGSENK